MIELAFTSIGDLRVPLLTVPRKARIIRVYGCPNLPDQYARAGIPYMVRGRVVFG